jgi:hypothetical protein
LYNRLTNVILSLGGLVSNTLGGNGIYINIQSLAASISINTISGLKNGYNSLYDVIYYWPDFAAASDLKTILDNWYNKVLIPPI